MASDGRGRVQPQLADNGLSSRMIFSDEAIHFSRAGGGDHSAPRKPAAVSGFEIDGDQSRFGRAQCGSQNPGWNLDGGSQSEGSDDDDVDDDDDFDEGDGLISLEENNNVKNGNNSSDSVQSSSEKGNGEKARNLQERHSSFVLSRGITVKDGNLNGQQQQGERVGDYEHAITAVQPQLFSAHMTNGDDASSSKETRRDNGYGFGGGKEVVVADDPGESLRTHLLDPITGILMDDGMILPCGHSFGGGGMLHVYKMRACCKCSRPILDNSARPNLALRAAVQAFRREEESQSSKAPKRKRERFEQEKFSYDDPYAMDSRGKGVQFPFVVSDRVIIKGNKRTPERFVGRVAVVTTQCLNGWYVVKTLDNAECVKLQYRSLAKVSDDSPLLSNTMQNKPLAPSWL